MKNWKHALLATICVAVVCTACGSSDQQLQAAVNERLASAKIAGVAVSVREGTAYLSGMVEDADERTRAEESARSVEGIRAVDASRLDVKPTPQPVDPMLQVKAEEVLNKAGCTGAVATISDGTVTLTGSVPELKYAECLKVIEDAGVGRLDNQLGMKR